ncbi:chemotaxis protein CheB [Actinoplanes sp. GCM10030250]|uniref:chemotaxis protein CheB n=1 Tax=Actinoplanes sp. GCM10030250 TaxID=3273376 RepID=UPI003623B93C
MVTGNNRPPVVALVCSAGGLQAIERILSGLTPGFPAAVIVLRHQDPQAANLLATILQRSSRLPVRLARDGDALIAGRVLVAPAGYHTMVTCGYTIVLVRSGDRPPYRPSADLLLTSVAIAARNRAVVVVLSGYGIDGATGATAIHHLGGTVIASDESTSAVFAMPYATISRAEVIDHVLPVGEISALLAGILIGRVRRSSRDRISPASAADASDRHAHPAEQGRSATADD